LVRKTYRKQIAGTPGISVEDNIKMDPKIEECMDFVHLIHDVEKWLTLAEMVD
jgi:hypothetical protein